MSDSLGEHIVSEIQKFFYSWLSSTGFGISINSIQILKRKYILF